MKQDMYYQMKDLPGITVAAKELPLNPAGATSNKVEPYLRLAETYLIKAEVELKLNQPGLAANTINGLRRRANETEISAGDVTLDLILDERSRELIFEEHRRYTLRRTG